MQEDEEPTPEELRQAEDLARALDRGHAPNPPEDALSAAALLRFARRGASLSAERHEAILAEAMAGAKRRRPAARRIFLLSALGLSAAAAAVLVLTRAQPVESAHLPAPPQSLLSAQLEAARVSAGSVVALDAEMRPYREGVYAALEERYRK